MTYLHLINYRLSAGDALIGVTVFVGVDGISVVDNTGIVVSFLLLTLIMALLLLSSLVITLKQKLLLLLIMILQHLLVVYLV